MHGLTLLAQANPSPDRVTDWLQWMFVWGEPSITEARAWGGLMTWAKVVGLYCLMAWVVGWLLASARANTVVRKSNPIKLYVVLAAIVAGLVAAMLGVLDQTGQLKLAAIPPGSGIKPANWLGLLGGALLIALIEYQLWTVLRKRGNGADLACLLALHVAFVLGFVVARLWIGEFVVLSKARLGAMKLPEEGLVVPDWRVLGTRIGVTYMGLVALVRILSMMAGEVVSLRWRRIYSIAWQAVVEANRSNRAPWVVVSVFAVILAFTHWFLRSGGERDAELSKMFVSTLTLLCSLLISVMVGFVAPRSMPRDIQNQTIYTVVSKPVRRLELIWGRLLGYLVLVTALLAIFGGISLIYLDRVVYSRIDLVREEAAKLRASRPDYAKLLDANADQLAGRMSARVPVMGSLSFVDSMNTARRRGIDVGQEQVTRSHIEGATPARALWKFGLVRDPFDPRRTLDLRVPVASLLLPGTLESVEDRLLNLQDEQAMAAQGRGRTDATATEVARSASETQARDAEITSLREQLQGLRDQEKDFRQKAANPAMPAAEKTKFRQLAQDLHSRAIPVEMTFTIYRTTKGVLGDPVLASMAVKNPRPGTRVHTSLFPIREYYTNRQSIPASSLVGSRGNLEIEVRCATTNQYLGMAESDLYILASQGGWRVNFLKGLAGIWLQAMVLSAIGLFAGTFLSWPVALLTTVAFFVAGEVAFGALAQLSLQAELGGGPFESLIRLLSHENLMNDLAPTPAVIVAKTADAIVMPAMSRLVYLVPNFGALDVTNTVANGFAVTWSQLRDLILMGLGYALPFSVAGYFILKNREVAA